MGGYHTPELSGNHITIGRHKDFDFLLWQGIEYELNGSTEVGIGTQDKGLVKEVQVGMVNQVGCQIDITLLLLMADPGGATVFALPRLFLEMTENGGDTVMLVGSDKGEMPVSRRGKPIGKSSEIVNMSQMFLARFDECADE